jgi:adrenodoxin-NADP+ reductase
MNIINHAVVVRGLRRQILSLLRPTTTATTTTTTAAITITRRHNNRTSYCNVTSSSSSLSSYFSSLAADADDDADAKNNQNITSGSVNDDGDDEQNKNKNRQNQHCTKIAIVGSGPSGCYTAKYLIQSLNKLNVKTCSQIDIIERLPTPYGLVRNGVAPDHPEVKNVQNDFNNIFFNNNFNDNDNSDEDEEKHGSKVHFFGNVTVGDDDDDDDNSSNDGDKSDDNSSKSKNGDISLNELRQIYDIVVLAYGCESDREFHLPIDIIDEVTGGDVIETSSDNTDTSSVNLDGILSAREFVNWYNGHPDFGNWITKKVQYALYDNESGNGNTKQKDKQNETQIQNIVIIGHGNVALDCGRILAKSRNNLNTTDITTRSLNILRPLPVESSDDNDNEVEHPINTTKRNISIIGRRGHIQGAFTIKEVRELTKLKAKDDDEDDETNGSNGDNSGALFVVRQDELDMGMTDTSKEELKTIRPKQRIHKLLTGHATTTSKEEEDDDADIDNDKYNTRVDLRFLLNPVRYEAVRIIDDDSNESLRLKSVICERTKLIDGDDVGAQQKAIGTGVFEKIDADLCLISIGYKGIPIDEYTKKNFNTSKGILTNNRGRVIESRVDDGGSMNMNLDNLAPIYVSGWLKRGPSGIIGTNINDAKETVQSIIEDIIISNENQNQNDNKNNQNESSLEDILKERNIQYINWNGYYNNINKYETTDDKHKRHIDQPREKIVDREQLIKIGTQAQKSQ